MVNDPDQGPTFEQGWVVGGETYIDVTLATTSLFRLVHSWQVQSCLPLDSDHHALTYTIQLTPLEPVDRGLIWRKVHWDSFRPALRQTLA